MADVTNKRPEYLDRADEWRLMRDSARGETAIKAGGTAYLPMPSGFRTDDDGGLRLYAAYQSRAQFPEITSPTVQAMVGVIHQREIKIDLPDSLAGLWESATRDGLPLEALHRRVTAELLTAGRYSLLVGASSTGSELPYLIGYTAESLINWDDDRTFFVLDESGLVRDGFDWREEKKYRVLELVGGRYEVTTYTGDTLAASDPRTPTARGEKVLDEIPFVVMGPRDLSLPPEAPPLMGVARAAEAIYQLSADYRWQLFMTGQETLFIINGSKPDMVGAGVIVELQGGGDGNPPNAKYVGPAGTGIAAHRTAILDEVQNAAAAGARLFNAESGRAQESGEARRIRYIAETASLMSVAQSSCAGLEKALRYVGRMKGLSDSEIEEIVVTPPKGFIDRKMSPQEVQAIMGLWEKGLLAYETVYENLQEGEIASVERSAEEELALIEQEDAGRGPGPDELAAITPSIQPAA